MSSLSPQNSLLSWSNRLRRKLLPWRHFPRDMVCGYPVYRGWSQNAAHEVAAHFRPDAVIVQSHHPHRLIDQFRKCNVPTAAYFHEVIKTDHLEDIPALGIPVLSNSPFTAARLKERCDIQSTVLLPLIEPRFYKTPTRRRRVLFVNTVERKGLGIALALAQRRPDIPFDFVRSWILNREQARALGNTARRLGNIRLHPPVQDMRPLYARARIVLAPSLCEEAWGRVVTEAHLNGIPVIASERGGLPQAVGPGGILVPADATLERWESALGSLWDDEEHYRLMSEAASHYAARGEIQPQKLVADFVQILHRHFGELWEEPRTGPAQ